MFRGKTVRTLFVVFAAVLMSLQFFTPTQAFASPQKSEVSSCGESEYPQKQKVAPPLRSRDRSREEDLVPEEPSRALLECDPAAGHPLATPDPAFLRTSSRSSTALSPATLQVFRC
ncbi:hypothetical protein ACFYPC_33440 [Streptomyces sp. NPDC005808]|uniref:hypothetical protein n=1 Tax=Streptomyces sp. NPDC005808 TaxID=3364734 RepID=UPI0036D1A45E